jgi:hypothetical protein
MRRTKEFTLKVLDALADGRTRRAGDLCAAFDCDMHVLEEIARSGLVRFLDVLGGGKTICITPRGLELVLRNRAQLTGRKEPFRP